MKYDRPITYNTNPITSSRGLRKAGRNLFFSLGVPVVFTLIAVILSMISTNPLFKSGDDIGTIKNIMVFIKTMVLT